MYVIIAGIDRIQMRGHIAVNVSYSCRRPDRGQPSDVKKHARSAAEFLKK